MLHAVLVFGSLDIQSEVLKVVRRDLAQGDMLLQATSASEEETCSLDSVNGKPRKALKSVKVTDLHSPDMSILLVLRVS